MNTAADRTRTDDLRFTKPLDTDVNPCDVTSGEKRLPQILPEDAAQAPSPPSPVPSDLDLETIRLAWPRLPQAIRAGIAAMVRAAVGEETSTADAQRSGEDS